MHSVTIADDHRFIKTQPLIAWNKWFLILRFFSLFKVEEFGQRNAKNKELKIKVGGMKRLRIKMTLIYSYLTCLAYNTDNEQY